MHIGFPIRWPANLTITLIERDQSRVICEPSLVHPCAQRVAVAERGCLFLPPSEVKRPGDCLTLSEQAQRWVDDCDCTGSEPSSEGWTPHRIPRRWADACPAQKYEARTADVPDRLLDLYA